MLTLEITISGGEAEIKRFPGPVSIGRDAGDIVVDDPQVSVRHAEIRIAGREMVYVDLGSTNGSFTPEGQPISRLVLNVGSTVCLGTSRLTVRGLPGQDTRRRRRLGPTGTLVTGAPVTDVPVTDVPVTDVPVTDVPESRPPEVAPGARGTFPVPGKLPRGTTEPAPAHKRPPPGYPGLAPIIVSEPQGAARRPLDLTAPLQLLAICWREYQRYWLSGAVGPALVLVPLALSVRLFEGIPELETSALRTLQLGAGGVAVLWWVAVGNGAAHEYALRLALGQPFGPRQALNVQLARTRSFLRDTWAALGVALLGILCCVVPGVLASFYLFPAHLVEGRRGTELNRRSFELFQRRPLATLPTLLVAAASLVLLSALATLCQSLPVVRHGWGGLTALGACVVIPFALFVHYRTYLTLRTAQEGQQALERDLVARGLI